MLIHFCDPFGRLANHVSLSRLQGYVSLQFAIHLYNLLEIIRVSLCQICLLLFYTPLRFLHQCFSSWNSNSHCFREKQCSPHLHYRAHVASFFPSSAVFDLAGACAHRYRYPETCLTLESSFKKFLPKRMSVCYTTSYSVLPLLSVWSVPWSSRQCPSVRGCVYEKMSRFLAPSTSGTAPVTAIELSPPFPVAPQGKAASSILCWGTVPAPR